jgi:hypothetical protein
MQVVIVLLLVKMQMLLLVAVVAREQLVPMELMVLVVTAVMALQL